jgi:phage terminase large subunit-like protein
MSESSIFSRLAIKVADDWKAKARPEQLPPDGDWTVWLYCGGRGSGKTRAGAEWTIVGAFDALEDQLCTYAGGSSDSPDRLDACVYALTDLMLNGNNLRISAEFAREFDRLTRRRNVANGF